MLEPAIQDKRRWWYREDILLIVMLGALFFLPGLHRIPLFDRDEPRFATAARNMLETGDFIVPRFNGQLRPDKPPLVYWLMDLGYLATGVGGGAGELGARLPSAVCGTLTLIVVYFMVGSRFGRLTGFVAALMLGSCPLFLVESRMATADATMLLGIVMCMACAWRAWDAAGASGGGEAGSGAGRMPRADYLLDRTGEHLPMMIDQLPAAGGVARKMPVGMALLFWVALAWGALAKGVPLAFVLIPMIVLSLVTGSVPAPLRRWRVVRWNWGWWRGLRPAMGVPVLIVLVGWWVWWAGTATHWKLITDMVGTHFLNRIGVPTADMTGGGTQDAMKSYGKPPGFYLLMVWGTFWPWSILLVPAAFHTWRRLRGRTAIAIDPRPYQFLMAWIVPMWVLLEVARGKLFHYPLPLYVPLAILCADTLVQSWNRLTDVLAAKWFGAARWGTMVIWLAMGAAVLVGSHLAPDRDLFWMCLPFGLALMATGLANAMTWGRPSWPYVVALCWGGSLMVADLMILAEMPELQVSRIAGREMKELKKMDPALQLGVAGYEEATLIFYSGQNMVRFNDAADLLKRVPFMPERTPESDPYVVAVEEKVRQELDEQHIKYTELPRTDTPQNLEAFRISGFNTGNMKPVAVTLITNVPPPAPMNTSSKPTTVP